MEAQERREAIRQKIQQAQTPVSASKLAEMLHVSRQIIVGDVALLRAQGLEIVATAKGYILPERAREGRFIGKIACQHSAGDTQRELYAIVDLEASVVDVIVAHDLYGEMTGQLNLRSRGDVDGFMERIAQNKARLLSELTQGVHLHTIACHDRDHFDQVRQALKELGFLYSDR